MTQQPSTTHLSARTAPPACCRSFGAAAVALLALTACPKSGEPSEEEPKPSALVETVAVARGSIEETVTAYGKVEPAADATEPVVAELESTVVKLWVRAGQEVKRGEAIAEVRETKAVRLDAARAKIDVDYAEKEVARVTSMRDKALATNADVASAEASLEKAKAELSALGGGGGTKTVRAPSAGLVQSVVVKPGDAVAAGGPLVLLSGAGERVRLNVEPSELARIKVGAVIHVHSLYASDVVDALVSQVHPQIDVETHQAAAVAALAGSPLLEGSTVRGDVVVRREESALLVPRRSIVDGAVFVIDGGKAKKVAVDVVIDDGVHVAIEPKGELKEGALVVTVGAAELEDGIAVHTGSTADQSPPRDQPEPHGEKSNGDAPKRNDSSPRAPRSSAGRARYLLSKVRFGCTCARLRPHHSLSSRRWARGHRAQRASAASAAPAVKVQR